MFQLAVVRYLRTGVFLHKFAAICYLPFLFATIIEFFSRYQKYLRGNWNVISDTYLQQKTVSVTRFAESSPL